MISGTQTKPRIDPQLHANLQVDLPSHAGFEITENLAKDVFKYGQFPPESLFQSNTCLSKKRLSREQEERNRFLVTKTFFFRIIRVD